MGNSTLRLNDYAGLQNLLEPNVGTARFWRLTGAVGGWLGRVRATNGFMDDLDP